MAEANRKRRCAIVNRFPESYHHAYYYQVDMERILGDFFISDILRVVIQFIGLVYWPKTQLVHKHHDPYDVDISRGTKWANPFLMGRDGDAYIVNVKYQSWLFSESQKALRETIKIELTGKILGCSHDLRFCHGRVILQLLNPFEMNSTIVSPIFDKHIQAWIKFRQVMEEKHRMDYGKVTSCWIS